MEDSAQKKLGSYRLRPLSGQVLVEILPADKRSAGGIELPQRTASPEENQQAARDPIMPPGLIGTVKAIGPWPKLPNGMAVMPEFGVNARVVIGNRAGLDLQRGIGERLKMVRNDQVLAILTDKPFDIKDWAGGPGPEIGMY